MRRSINREILHSIKRVCEKIVREGRSRVYVSYLYPCPVIACVDRSMEGN